MSKTQGLGASDKFDRLYDRERRLKAMRDAAPELYEALEKAADFLRSAPLESGVCCCGSPVEGHGFADGHSPVDELQYHASNLAEELEAALAKARGAQTQSETSNDG